MSSTSPSIDGSDIRVLHVDDDEAFLDTVELCFEHAHDDITIATAADAPSAIERLEREEFDCVVSDYEMPRMDGLELLREVRTRSDVPFIVFTGTECRDLGPSVFATGETEYVHKSGATNYYGELADRIHEVVDARRNDSR